LSRRNTWLPQWLPAALDSRSVVIEYFGRERRGKVPSGDMLRLWSGFYWHVEKRRGQARYVVGDLHGPFRSASAAADHARVQLGLTQRNAVRRVA